MNELFPLFLKLAGRPCLVVGGGLVAEAKMEGLVRCGADVQPGVGIPMVLISGHLAALRIDPNLRR